MQNGAISQSLVAVGGPSLQEECSKNAPNGIGYGEIVLTPAGKLQCDYVIHGACSRWVKGNEEIATKVCILARPNLLSEHFVWEIVLHMINVISIYKAHYKSSIYKAHLAKY